MCNIFPAFELGAQIVKKMFLKIRRYFFNFFSTNCTSPRANIVKNLEKTYLKGLEEKIAIFLIVEFGAKFRKF